MSKLPRCAECAREFKPLSHNAGWKFCSKTCRLRNKRRRYKQKPQSKIKAHAAYVARKYGISQQEYNAQAKRQKGHCAICNKPSTLGGFRLDLSRGLLCHRCNEGLSRFDDNPRVVGAAVRYLAGG